MFDFIDDIENAYAASDLVVSRAGATAISEILFLKKPSILFHIHMLQIIIKK